MLANFRAIEPLIVQLIASALAIGERLDFNSKGVIATNFPSEDWNEII